MSERIKVLLAHKKKDVTDDTQGQALGRSRGGYGTKIHLVCDGKGNPIVADVSAGQEHESQYFESILDKIEIRGKHGRPRKRPETIAGDKAYSSQQIRESSRKRGITEVIPTKSNQKRDSNFDKRAYKERNIVERCIGWLKECRRIATRYEKLALHFLGMLELAMVLRYL